MNPFEPIAPRADIQNIFNALENNKFSYEKIKEESYIGLLSEDMYDLNVIVGFKGRKEFWEPIIQSFTEAIKYHEKINPYGWKICLTMVEHSEFQLARKWLDGKVNYIYTPGNVQDQYSRSFAYNFGVKYGNIANYYLLHDLDILVKKNFFSELYDNFQHITQGNDVVCDYMQSYGGRRVLYISQDLTREVLKDISLINSYIQSSPGISPPMYNGQLALGSKGGSIFINRSTFNEIGGFDPELFWGYAAEDQMIWEKLKVVTGREIFADNPPIDMFHMWHPPTFASNPLLYQMENYFLQFKNMSLEDKQKYIQIKQKLFNEN